MTVVNAAKAATRTAVQVDHDPDEWELIDQDRTCVAIIWRCNGGWRSAAISAPLQRGITGPTFEQVLQHAIANF